MDETVTVPRWALMFILEEGEFCDDGPHGEGWPSAEMLSALRAIEDSTDSLWRRRHTDRR